MGLLSRLFGRSAARNAVVGGILGAAVGDKLDERQWRKDLLGEIQRAAARVTYEFDMASVRRTLNAPTLFELQRKPYPNQYRWPFDYPFKVNEMRLAAFGREADDAEWATEATGIRGRFLDLWMRSYDVGIMPWAHMPRNIAGDIVGTPRMLHAAIDALERMVKNREKIVQIDYKFGVPHDPAEFGRT